MKIYRTFYTFCWLADYAIHPFSYIK